MDKAQNLYGTTAFGGASTYGTVFKLSRKDKETILYAFAGGSDGAYPVSGLIDKGGYLYGTTFGGGANSSGTVFKTPNKPGSDSVLYAFTGASDGAQPKGGVLDEAGNLFGTAYAGGDAGCDSDAGCGVVFEIKP